MIRPTSPRVATLRYLELWPTPCCLPTFGSSFYLLCVDQYLNLRADCLLEPVLDDSRA